MKKTLLRGFGLSLLLVSPLLCSASKVASDTINSDKYVTDNFIGAFISALSDDGDIDSEDVDAFFEIDDIATRRDYRYKQVLLTVLVTAVAYGHLSIVERSLGVKGINAMKFDDGCDALGIALVEAAERGHLAIVERLLAVKDIDTMIVESSLHGIGISAIGKALFAAASEGQIAVVERLLVAKNINTAMLIKADVISCLLSIASDDGYVTAVDNGICITFVLDMKNVDIDSQAACIAAPAGALVWAAGYGHMSVVERLLTVKGINDMQLLHTSGLAWALIFAAACGHVAIVERLLAVKDINMLSECVAAPAWALVYAAKNGHFTVVERLLAIKDIGSMKISAANAISEARKHAVRGDHQLIIALIDTHLKTTSEKTSVIA